MKRLLLLLLLLVPGSLFAQELVLTLALDSTNEAAGTISGHATATNPGGPTATGISIHVDILNPGIGELTVSDPAWTCTGLGTAHISCSSTTGANLAIGESRTLPFTLRLPDGAGRVAMRAGLGWSWSGEIGNPHHVYAPFDLNAALFKRFTVTNENDSGDGSLRAAMSNVTNDPVCATLPCAIDFAGDVDFIAPLSALPVLAAADLEIDGQERVALNGLGIDGYAHGLEIHGTRVAVRGLDISGFLANGIDYFPATEGQFTFERNAIHGNGQRGIQVETGRMRQSAIRQNVLTANARSGIFLRTSTDFGFPLAPVITIEQNRIEWNGASGIFLGPQTEEVLITNNEIKFNRDFGIAIATGSRYATVGVNRIERNGLAGIDLGLDGVAAGAARLESATYDPITNTTTITGQGAPVFGGGYQRFTVSLYANSLPDAEGEQYLGEATPDATTGRINAVLPGDLRGKWITALQKRSTNMDGSLLYDTGEFSNAVEVH